MASGRSPSMGPTAGLARRTMPSSFSMTTASEVLPRTAASVLRSSASAWYARALLRGAEPGRDDGGGLDVVRPVGGRCPAGEEERARGLDAAVDRHRQHGAEAGCSQDSSSGLAWPTAARSGTTVDWPVRMVRPGIPRRASRCARRCRLAGDRGNARDGPSPPGSEGRRPGSRRAPRPARGRRESGRDAWGWASRKARPGRGEPGQPVGEAHVGRSSSAQCCATSSTDGQRSARGRSGPRRRCAG